MSRPYEFDDMFEELFRLAERLFEETFGPRRHEGNSLTESRGTSEPDEVIEGKDRVTYLLHAPGYNKEDFLVSVLDDSVEVKTKDFLRRRGLGTRVKPETAETTYRNGVLSINVRRGGAR